VILGTVGAVETFNRIGASEAEAFWLDFLRSLTRRGLRGLRSVTLVISDAHQGPKAAVSSSGCSTDRRSARSRRGDLMMWH
jgi:putative transposase